MMIHIFWGGTSCSSIEILRSFACSLLIADYVFGVIVNPDDEVSNFFRNVAEHSFYIGRFVKSKQKGRAIAQEVSRRLPTAAARVQTRVWLCGIL
jgi:hypothetical protein